MVNWTEEQKQAIEARDVNLIVSAAAGSGKTAVLIERIFRLIQEGQADIRHILMITFTVKAAREMKEKLQAKFDQALETDPDEFLMQQRNLLEAADIKTIDSFCLQVVRNHFHELDLDVRFGILDDKVRNQLEQEALDLVFERCYEEADPVFLQLAETYGKLGSDQEFRKVVIDLHNFSQSNSEPERWLAEAVCSFTGEAKDFEATPLGAFFRKSILPRELTKLEAHLNQEQDCLARGAEQYEAVHELDRQQVEALLERLKEGLKEFFDYDCSFSKLPTVRTADQGSAHKEFKGARDKLKKAVQKFKAGLEKQLSVLERSKGPTLALTDLVRSYAVELMRIKRSRNLFDYNDIEHFTLELLQQEQVRELYRNYYKFIFIDEFQDTNGVQETIFRLAAREDNLFFVGDVKQSIYRFRLADSSIFVDTMKRYGDEENSISLTLNRNFRSSKSVVEGVNAIFSRLMDGTASPVRYEQEARLIFGSGIENEGKVEAYIVDLGEDAGEAVEDSDEEDLLLQSEKVHKEASLCARRIRELVDATSHLPDGDPGKYCYRDFTILGYSVKNVIEEYRKVFDGYNIPLYGDLDTGFLQSLSVQFLLDFLEVVNNSNSDIPLLDVLKSSVYGFNLEELALIRKATGYKQSFYSSLLIYSTLEEGLPGIREKTVHFLESLEVLKKELQESNLTDFIIKLLTGTGAYYSIFRKPDGDQEALNIKELLRLASVFEADNSSHLTGFIQYFREIRKNDLSIPSVSSISEQDDVVRITTIHKSKGLEYPNVFLIRLGDQWSRPGKAPIGYHQKLGIGPVLLEKEQNVKVRTLAYEIISKAKDYETMEDMLNLLYVGMTRARKNLYLIGSDRKYKDKKENWKWSTQEAFLNPKSFYDLMLPFILYDDEVSGRFHLFEERQDYKLEPVKLTPRLELEGSPEYLEIRERKVEHLPRKLSATDFISTASLDQALTRDLLRDELKIKPDFLEEKGITSVERGILFHLVMEILDFGREWTAETLNKEMDRLVEREVLTSKERAALDMRGIRGFLSSSFYRRIRKSEGYEKEKAFNLKISPSLIHEGYSGEEGILVQGIIDFYFIENGRAVLLDYKTDRVTDETVGERESEYKKQLRLYKMALEQVGEFEVAEAWLYFSSMGKFVRMEL